MQFLVYALDVLGLARSPDRRLVFKIAWLCLVDRYTRPFGVKGNCLLRKVGLFAGTIYRTGVSRLYSA